MPLWGTGVEARGLGKNGCLPKCLLGTDSASPTLPLVIGDRLGLPSSLQVHTEKSDWIYSELTKTVSHRALWFAKELKEREYAPSQPTKKRTPRRSLGSRGSKGLKDNAGGMSISNFSSEPRGGRVSGAGWWWGAPAAGPRQNCSVSWAGAHCKVGCYSSWCTLSSVSQGSRRIGTQQRRWGRLLRRHTTCGTWSLQHNPRSGVNWSWPRFSSSSFLPQHSYLVGPARYFRLFHWAHRHPPPPPPKYKWRWLLHQIVPKAIRYWYQQSSLKKIHTQLIFAFCCCCCNYLMPWRMRCLL